jgi:hypothetical protein
VIEEAHRLLRNTSQESFDPEVANIRGKALETFCNMLSEIRAFGEGIVIVDQIPSKLAPDVVKNTSLKVIHRIVARDDRELVGNTMTLSEEQKKRLSTLMAGEAIAYREGLDGSFLLAIPGGQIKGPSSGSKDLKNHMEHCFYRKRPDLLLFKQGCYGCKNNMSCESIKRKVQTWIETHSVQESFSRFFLSVLEGAKVAQNGYQELIQAISRLNGHRFSTETIPYVYCTGMHLIEKNIGEKGYIFSWKFNLVKDLCSRFVRIFESLSEGSIDMEDRIREFKEAYVTICKDGIGPGVYCESCEEPCLYLLEVKGILNSDPFVKALDEGIRRADGTDLWRFLAEMCKKVAGILSVSKDPKILRSLSLCAANLIGIVKNYPVYEQKRIFENIRHFLEESKQ